MTMTDPIADMLTRIRNANMVRHEKLELPASNLKKEIAEILKREGFVRDVEYAEDNKQGIIRIFLKYGKENERVITGLKRISKPGLRVYAKTNEGYQNLLKISSSMTSVTNTARNTHITS